MSEVLVRISQAGYINQYYIWNHEKEKTQIKSMYSLLSKSNFTKFDQLLENTSKKTLVESIVLEGKNHYLFIHEIGHHYLLYLNEHTNKECQESIVRLIKTFASQYMNPIMDHKEENKFLFDSIQKLNNDLINKQRETAKLNQELNRLNKILNNRLVKDPLTELVSRYQYRDEILMKIAEFPNQYGLFWFLDIDDFKRVNDTYGHKVGDLYLVEVANRLWSLPFEDTIKMRIAGDEFGLFIPNVKSIDSKNIDRYYHTFEQIMNHPIKIDDWIIPLSFSVGISIYKKDTEVLHLLIDYADYAMYQAKDQGKNQYKLFDSSTYKTIKKS